MKTIGSFLTLLCVLTAIGLLIVGYTFVFEYRQVISIGPLPAYSDYSKDLEARHDSRAYALWTLFVLGCVIIPVAGFIRSRKSISSRKVTDWVLFGISSFQLAFWSWGLVIRLRGGEVDWVLLPACILFAGCLFGHLVFWKRARSRIDEDAPNVSPSTEGSGST